MAVVSLFSCLILSTNSSVSLEWSPTKDWITNSGIWTANDWSFFNWLRNSRERKCQTNYEKNESWIQGKRLCVMHAVWFTHTKERCVPLYDKTVEIWVKHRQTSPDLFRKTEESSIRRMFNWQSDIQTNIRGVVYTWAKLERKGAGLYRRDPSMRAYIQGRMPEHEDICYIGWHWRLNIRFSCTLTMEPFTCGYHTGMLHRTSVTWLNLKLFISIMLKSLHVQM